MPAYQPGQGINKAALERLKARKQADDAIADIPAEDKSQQWDKILGEGAKKKLRCGYCTRPLSVQEQEEKQLVCSACSARESAAKSTAEPASVAPGRSAFGAEEFSASLFYYGRQRLAAKEAPKEAPAPAAVPEEAAEKAKNAAASIASAKSHGMKSQSSENLTVLQRTSAVHRGKLVPQGHVGLSVLSFNILAACYVRVEGQPWNAFSFCKDEHLSWKQRLPRIVKLLRDSLADIICLQEVTLEHRTPTGGKAEEWTLPAWTDELEGYTGILQGLKQKDWEKTAERNQRMVGCRAPTGVATFFRNTDLEECQASKSGAGSGLTVFLRRKGEPANLEVAVANVHLIGDPAKGEEHTKALSSVVNNFGRREHRLICGDFNGECQPGSSVAEWAAAEGFWDAPTGTSWAEPGKALRLDHVLHSPGLKVQAVSGSISDAEVASGLPCATCPSDHSPVAVLFSGAVRGKCPW